MNREYEIIARANERWTRRNCSRVMAASVTVLALLVFAFSAYSQTSGKVVGVTDGDTVNVLGSDNLQIKVRLAGIDAPEKRQAFSDKSKRHLSDLLYGKTVTLEGGKSDRYGRLVAKVLVDGIDANLEQVRAGLAWHFKRYEREQSSADRRVYAAAEFNARSSKINIWSVPAPVAPWEFRDGARVSTWK